MINREFLAKDMLCALDPVAFARHYLDFSLDAWQKEVLRSRHRNIILNCSRQSGKSTLGAILTSHQAYYHPNSICLLFSPSQRQSSELFRKVSDFLRGMPAPPKRIEDNKLSLELENHSRVVSLPGDAGRIRGYTDPDLIIEDEAAQVPDELHAAVRPMLAVSGGKLLLLSTPYGPAGHFYEIFNKDDDLWDRYSVTAYECSHIPRDFLEQERSSRSQWEFDQEYLCRFVGASNQPFTFQDVAGCLTDQITPLFLYSDSGQIIEPIERAQVVNAKSRQDLYVGVDLGKASDHTAIAIVEKVGRQKHAIYQVVHLERLPLGTSYPRVVEYVKRIIESSRINSRLTLVVDKTGVGNAIVDYFQTEKLNPCGVTITSGQDAHGKRGGDWNVPRDDLIIQTQYLIDAKRLLIAQSIPLALDLVEELTHFKASRYAGMKKESLPYSQQLHDDLAMSLILALWYAENGGWFEIEFKAV